MSFGTTDRCYRDDGRLWFDTIHKSEKGGDDED